MKIIAFYLPQFHEIKENNEWYGKGFTEWCNMKRARPLFKEHYQPRIPLEKNYYDLADVNVLKWQAEIARKYGIYGFCFYHYWFEGRMIMEKPMEMLLKDTSIDINFCICWANHNWTKAMKESSKEIVLRQTYGKEEEWEAHFDYWYPFFCDSRYICKNGKPLVIIYRPEAVPELEKMLLFWQDLARKKGLKGIAFAYQYPDYNHRKADTGYLFDYAVEYQPAWARKRWDRYVELLIKGGINLLSVRFGLKIGKWNSISLNYDTVWKNILSRRPEDGKYIPGAFVDWDNTPRRGKKGSYYYNVTPEKFQKYLSCQIKRAREIYHKDMLFVFAWNEWGEGGYLEPDERYGDGMLDAVRRALEENNELEKNFIGGDGK